MLEAATLKRRHSLSPLVVALPNSTDWHPEVALPRVRQASAEVMAVLVFRGETELLEGPVGAVLHMSLELEVSWLLMVVLAEVVVVVLVC